MKAAKNLYKKEDEQITRYEKRELMIMLANRLYHSPEISEEDEEDPSKPSSVFTITHGARTRFVVYSCIFMSDLFYFVIFLAKNATLRCP